VLFKDHLVFVSHTWGRKLLDNCYYNNDTWWKLEWAISGEWLDW